MAAPAATTDFFELQDESRRETRRLIVYFLFAALFVIASYCAAAWLAWIVLAKFVGWPLRPPATLFSVVGAVVLTHAGGLFRARGNRSSEGIPGTTRLSETRGD